MAGRRTLSGEDAVLDAIWTYLNAFGFRFSRIVERIPFRGRNGAIVGKFSTPGMPDLVGYAKKGVRFRGLPLSLPLPLYIEVKRPGGRHRIAQTVFIQELGFDEVVGFFADSVDEAVRLLNLHGFSIPFPSVGYRQ